MRARTTGQQGSAWVVDLLTGRTGQGSDRPVNAEFQKALAAARVRAAAEVARSCNYGNCVVFVSPDGTINGGGGLAGCPCDQTRGWRAKRLAQAGRPHPPVKANAAGRNRSRVDRRARELQLLATYYLYLT